MFEKIIFKKIELWILLVFIILFLIFISLFGGLIRSYIISGNKFATIGEIAMEIAELPTKPAKIINNVLLSRYIAREQKFQNIEEEKFYYEYNDRKDLGYVLISKYDNDKKINVVDLLDLNEQKIIYQWYNNSHDTIDHPILIKNGSLITKDYSSGNLLEIDVCSNVTVLNSNIFLHHSTEMDHEENLWIPIRYYPIKNISKKLGTINFQDDGISKINLAGKLLYEKSIIEILFENELDFLIYGGPTSDDPIHLNDIQPALKDTKFWKKGDLFLSLRNQSMIILYRPSTNKIIWYKQGPWTHQHDVDIISDSKISIFDNNISLEFFNGGNNDYAVYDFENDKVTYPYSQSFVKYNISTKTGGLSDTINSNEIFIEESNNGRLMILDRNGNQIWHYLNKDKKDTSYILSWSRYIQKNNLRTTIDKLKDYKC